MSESAGRERARRRAIRRARAARAREWGARKETRNSSQLLKSAQLCPIYNRYELRSRSHRLLKLLHHQVYEVIVTHELIHRRPDALAVQPTAAAAARRRRRVWRRRRRRDGARASPFSPAAASPPRTRPAAPPSARAPRRRTQAARLLPDRASPRRARRRYRSARARARAPPPPRARRRCPAGCSVAAVSSTLETPAGSLANAVVI